MKKYLVFSGGSSHKFWAIEVKGKKHTVRFGKVGTDGTSKTKDFEDAKSAKIAAEKLIQSKLKKGYQEKKNDASGSGKASTGKGKKKTGAAASAKAKKQKKAAAKSKKKAGAAAPAKAKKSGAALVGAKPTTLVYQDGSSAKFWSISVKGATHTVTYGRIGTDGTVKSKDHADAKAAKAAASKLLEAKLRKGYVPSGELPAAEKSKGVKVDHKSSKTQAGKAKPGDGGTKVSKDDKWKQVEQEFVAGARQVLAKLAKKRKKEPSITFWMHNYYLPVFVYTEKQYDGDGVGGFDLPSLEVESSDPTEAPHHDASASDIKKHFKAAIMTLKKEGAFDPLVSGYLTVWIDSEDDDRIQICTVGDTKKSKQLFVEEPLELDLSMVGGGKGPWKWWYATDTFIDDEVEFKPDMNKLRDKLKSDFRTWGGASLKDVGLPKLNASLEKTTKIYDWMSGDAQEVWSYKLCALMKGAGVANIEYYPIEITHKATKQKSASFYQLAVIVGVSDAIVQIDEDDENYFGLDHIGFETELLRGRKDFLEQRSEKVFRVLQGRNYGFVMRDDVKLACEANGITGVNFMEIPMWNVDELKFLEKRHKGGDGRATVRLAMLYGLGQHVKQDGERALELVYGIVTSDDETVQKDLDDMLHLLDYYYEPNDRGWVCGVSALYDYYIKREVDRAKRDYDKMIALGWQPDGKYFEEMLADPLFGIDEFRSSSYWRKAKYDFIESLIEKGADLSRFLFDAATHGAPMKVFKLLCETYPETATSGVAPYFSADSVLGEAVQKRDENKAKYLIELGANVNHRNRTSRSILGLAKAAKCSKELVALIENSGGTKEKWE